MSGVWTLQKSVLSFWLLSSPLFLVRNVYHMHAAISVMDCVCSAPPIVGWFADRFGVPAVIIAASIFAMPWYTVLILEAHLSLFVVVDACASTYYSSLFMR